jgi:hypothetical protein
MLAKDFPQGVVEDVGRSVVVSQGPSTELREVCKKTNKRNSVFLELTSSYEATT